MGFFDVGEGDDLAPAQPLDPAAEYALPARFRFTPEQLGELARENARQAARAQSRFASRTAEERERERALREIPELLGAMGRVSSDLRFARGGRGHAPPAELEAALAHLARQLAEAFASAGRFDLAALHESDRKQKAQYLRLHRAVLRDDEHFCGHKAARYAVRDVYSVKHGRVMMMVRCAACKCLNVTTRRDVLAPLEAARAKRAEAVREHAGKVKRGG